MNAFLVEDACGILHDSAGVNLRTCLLFYGCRSNLYRTPFAPLVVSALLCPIVPYFAMFFSYLELLDPYTVYV